jgi:hypothetical protein
LIRLAQSDEKPRSNLKDFALVTLSQVFDKSPDAQQALVTEAQRNTISDSVWRLLGKSLSGEQMQIGEPQVRPDGGISNLRIPGITTYHNEANNQNFWSASVAPSWSAEDLNRRVAVIDQMLANTANPVAIQSLQNARLTLASQTASAGR